MYQNGTIIILSYYVHLFSKLEKLSLQLLLYLWNQNALPEALVPSNNDTFLAGAGTQGIAGVRVACVFLREARDGTVGGTGITRIWEKTTLMLKYNTN